MAQVGGHLWVSGQPGVPCGVVSAGGAGPPLRDTVLRGPQLLTAPLPLAHSPPPLPCSLHQPPPVLPSPPTPALRRSPPPRAPEGTPGSAQGSVGEDPGSRPVPW